VSGSVLFYVQHLLGIGHWRRALRIADGLAQEGLGVTLVSGGEPVPIRGRVCNSRIIQLPPIRARDAAFKELVDAAGHPVDDSLRTIRRATLLSVFAATQPDAVLIEAFPFGRRAFRFELDALIDAARSRQPRALVLCSLRDIVVVHDGARRPREIVDRVRADFDYVLIHGDPAFIPLEASFPSAPEIADRLIYTGYVAGAEEPLEADETASADEAAGTDEVVVSVGGGAVGGVLLSTALECRRRGCLPDLKWRLLCGPNLSETEFGILAHGLPPGVVLERFRPNFPRLLRRCRVSVSQAGYNTILDVLAARVSAVVVPFAAERETEQSLRAERLAARGVLEMVRESELSPECLDQAIARAIARGPGSISVATDGARRSARAIAELIRYRQSFPDASPQILRCGGLGL
jgi:predicted glycosyltransferase